jgi:DNA-directed RNA polymerase specialized sigma24 family protein
MEGSSLLELLHDPDQAVGLDQLDRELALEQLEAALADLPQPQRQVLELMADGCKQGEAAAAIGCSVAEFRRHQARGRAHLKQHLGGGCSCQAAAKPAVAAAVVEPQGELLEHPIQLQLLVA